MSVLPEGRITPEALDVFRSRIDKELRISWQFNELACREAIRNFAQGIGDDNPLWLDREYAAQTRYGGLVAPPSWYYSVFPTFVQQGLPGVHAFHSGNDWEFLHPVRENSRIKPKCIFTGFEEKESKFSGRTIIEYQLAEYYDQEGTLLARAKSWLVRAERGLARKTGKYKAIELPHPWSEEELAKIEADILNQKLQGSKPRFWEDLKEGDELPPLIKGPLGLTDEIAFIAGSGAAVLKANESALRLYRDHPNWGFRDVTFAMEPIAGVHWNKSAANSAGLPDCYDVGIQRNSWLLQMLTNWIGDDGWIKRAYAEYRAFYYFSDVIWIKGEIVKKYIDDDGEYCVDVKISTTNQRGEETMPGSATLVLPSREQDFWPLDRRV